MRNIWLKFWEIITQLDFRKFKWIVYQQWLFVLKGRVFKISVSDKAILAINILLCSTPQRGKSHQPRAERSGTLGIKEQMTAESAEVIFCTLLNFRVRRLSHFLFRVDCVRNHVWTVYVIPSERSFMSRPPNGRRVCSERKTRVLRTEDARAPNGRRWNARGSIDADDRLSWALWAMVLSVKTPHQAFPCTPYLYGLNRWTVTISPEDWNYLKGKTDITSPPIRLITLLPQD